jgi:hypothetical protein
LFNSFSTARKRMMYRSLQGRDTTIVAENGKKTIIKFNVKIQSIDNSINGKVKYSYSQDGGNFSYDKYGNRSKSVYKDEYMADEFRIYINDDTLFVGETFNATVWTNKKGYPIQISEPIKEELDEDKIVDSYKLEYPCGEKGTFSFVGRINYDSTNVFPFEYKFLVVDRK